MSDERLRELERAAALQPEDPETIDALIEERYRLGLPVEPELYGQRVFPPCQLTLPPDSEVIFREPGARESQRLEWLGVEPTLRSIPAAAELTVFLHQPGREELSPSLALLREGPRVWGVGVDPVPVDSLEELVSSLPPSVESLSLGLASRMVDLAPLGQLNQLTELILTDLPEPFPRGSLRGLEPLRRLDRLVLDPWPELSVADWEWLQGLPRLGRLAGWPEGAPPESVLRGLRKVPGLRRLDLSETPDLDLELVRDLSELRVLRLSSDVTDLGNSLPSWSKLEVLDASFLEINDDIALALPATLWELRVDGSRLSLDGFEHLTRLPLARLELTTDQHFGEEAWERALGSPQWSKLVELELFGAVLGSALAAASKGIASLDIGSAPAPSLAALGDWLHLRDLTLYELSGLTPENFESISSLGLTLQVLKLSQANFDPSTTLTSLRGLRDLSLAECPVHGLATALLDLDEVSYLSLSEVQADFQELLGRLGEHPALRTLNLDTCKLETAWLRDLLSAKQDLNLFLSHVRGVDGAALREEFGSKQVFTYDVS